MIMVLFLPSLANNLQKQRILARWRFLAFPNLQQGIVSSPRHCE